MRSPVVFTCAIGKLVFDDNTQLSKAKLIRDTLMAQKLNPKDNVKKLRTDQDCMNFVMDTFKHEFLCLQSVTLIPQPY